MSFKIVSKSSCKIAVKGKLLFLRAIQKMKESQRFLLVFKKCEQKTAIPLNRFCNLDFETDWKLI